MITKFKHIKDMAVFSDFTWDNYVKDKNGEIKTFSQVNVIYGRNYSGKTTLSRIIRAFETSSLSDKYGACSFSIETENGTLTESDYVNKKLLVRVFNDDFVRDNLRFIIDQSSTIAPFAILGSVNKAIEMKIDSIKAELGDSIEGKCTGLYALEAGAKKNFDLANAKYEEAKRNLRAQKNIKATDKKVGIKYQPERFGNQNYNIRELDKDIETILAESYKPLEKTQIIRYENYLKESSMKPPKEIKLITFKVDEIAAKVSELCRRSISSSDKIQELINDLVLQEWVRAGMEYNKGRDFCAFCGQPLKDSRWKELFSHFDEESEILTRDLRTVQNEIIEEREKVKRAFIPDISEFYSEYVESIEMLESRYKVESAKYLDALTELEKLIKCRINNLYKTIKYEFSAPICTFMPIFREYNKIRVKSINHAKEISTLKQEAQEQLRLTEVYNFTITIGYSNILASIDEFYRKKCLAESELYQIQENINQKQAEIGTLRKQQNNEEKGATKINEYLRNFFGHSYLSFVAKKQDSDDEKKVYFEIERNGKKAFNLSEGEKNLIAFCYFVAKLEDVETIGKRPIIWIDDPISSLDNNHIYFVYSLITQKILQQDCYEQLFITTHNLQFLKYLRVLSINNHRKNSSGIRKGNFFIERKGSSSFIKLMPLYLKKHGTEFNYWFECIFKCANQNEIKDENIHLFESFGNNARKFLETYLYYRYPDNKDFNEHLGRFFGVDAIPSILVRKLSDEQSHADGDLENHDLPFEELEVISAAKLLLKKLEAIDKTQYEALIASIQ